MSYANTKIEELDTKRQGLMKTIADMTQGAVSPSKLNQISDYLSDWVNIGIEDKRFVLDGLIDKFFITKDSLRVEWRV